MAARSPDRAQGVRETGELEDSGDIGAAEERARGDRQEGKAAGGFKHWFGLAATRVSEAVGSAWAFLAALVVLLVWVISGPIFGFSDTWQLIINTGTTIVTSSWSS